MKPDIHQTVAARLRGAAQRYTPNRRALVEALWDAERPLTIHELLVLRPDVPQSSAYRSLAILEQVGLVRRVVTNEEFTRFELDEQLTVHHHHLICSNCGAVDDVSIASELERNVERALRRVARRAGFTAVSHRLDLMGTCRNCA
jgi:Fur family transcriptional regulator, ferric uptake regulator